MIRGYSDHAANERTFLAWVRTGIAVIAFGFVIEKFNLFVLTIANASSLDAGRRLQLERLSGPLGRYDGLALILVGIAVVAVAATRFVRTGQLLDDQPECYHGDASAHPSEKRSLIGSMITVAADHQIPHRLSETPDDEIGVNRC